MFIILSIVVIGLFIYLILLPTYSLGCIKHSIHNQFIPIDLSSLDLSESHLHMIDTFECALLEHQFNFLGNYEYIQQPTPPQHISKNYVKYYTLPHLGITATICIGYMYSQANQLLSHEVYMELSSNFEDDYVIHGTSRYAPYLKIVPGPTFLCYDYTQPSPFIHFFIQQVQQAFPHHSCNSTFLKDGVETFHNTRLAQYLNYAVSKKQMCYNSSQELYLSTFLYNLRSVIYSYYHHLFVLPKLRQQGYNLSPNLSTQQPPKAKPFSRKTSLILQIVITLILFVVILIISLP